VKNYFSFLGISGLFQESPTRVLTKQPPLGTLKKSNDACQPPWGFLNVHRYLEARTARLIDLFVRETLGLKKLAAQRELRNYLNALDYTDLEISGIFQKSHRGTEGGKDDSCRN
jgi:hypothetical protein